MLVMLAGACSDGGANGKAAPAAPAREPVPVTLGTVKLASVPLQLNNIIGTVEAYNTIAVKSQVNAILNQVHFKEGQEVKAGDPLFTLDARPFEAALRQAEADKDKAKANLRQAEANVLKDKTQAVTARVESGRLEKLFAKGVVSRDEFDKARTTAESLEAAVHADEAGVQNAREAIRGAQATVDNARVQLEYCTIRSPIGGRTGNRLVDQGNLVKAQADTAMVTINQISPIYVTFSIPEENLADVKRYMGGTPLKVQAIIPDDEAQPAVGELTFMDNEVNRATGTITFKGTFANADRRLWPGQFVKVVLTLTVIPQAVLAPASAVQSGQQGSYVYAVKPDHTVEARNVVVSGDPIGNDVIVTQGLKGDETVVTDGQLRLAPGSPIKAREATPGSPGKPEGKRAKP